jgi:EmrB/QacA subfamily drug resistance transporter
MDRKWWTLIVVCVATFMLMLDVTVVNVAIPDIQRSLQASFSNLTWVINAYSLTLAAFLLTAGVVGDLFGRRALFAVGLAVFSASSLVCGLSSSSLMLDLARGAQGIGGAIMLATSLALIAQAFAGSDRSTAFGVYGAVIGGAVAVGPLVGGAITSGIGWRWIFFINVPIGVAGIILTLARVNESQERRSRRIDWLGFVSFSAALFLLIFALVRGNDEGWSSGLIIGLLAGAAALLVTFVLGELFQADPMLDLSLFRRPAMIGVSVVIFALGASIFASFLYITLYLQDVLGYSPLAAGLRFLPITVLSFFVAPLAGKATATMDSRWPLGAGMAAVALGCGLMAFTSPGSTWLVLLAGFLITGFGLGVVNPVIASAAVAVVPAERSGMASGTSSTFRQVGIAAGIAVLGAIFQAQAPHRTLSLLASTGTGRQVIAHGGGNLSAAVTGGAVRDVAGFLPPGAREVLLDAYRTAFTSSFNNLMTVAACTAGVGAIAAFGLIRQRDFAVSEAPGVPRAEPVHGA